MVVLGLGNGCLNFLLIKQSIGAYEKGFSLDMYLNLLTRATLRDYITHLTTRPSPHTVLTNSSHCLTLPQRKAPVPLPLGFENASVPAMAE